LDRQTTTWYDIFVAFSDNDTMSAIPLEVQPDIIALYTDNSIDAIVHKEARLAGAVQALPFNPRVCEWLCRCMSDNLKQAFANDNQTSAIAVATFKGHLEAMEFLIEHFGHVFDHRQLPSGGFPLLTFASHIETSRPAADWRETCEFLLSHGVVPNQVDSHGGTPFLIAVRQNYTDVALLFLQNGADPNASFQVMRPDGEIFTHHCIYAGMCSGNSQILSELLRRGAFIQNHRPLIALLEQPDTTRSKELEICRVLLKNIIVIDDIGQVISNLDSIQACLLLYVASPDDADKVAILLEACMQPDLRNNLGLAPGQPRK
jgi:hypothetical protein